MEDTPVQPANYFIDGIHRRDKFILSKAITLIESNKSEDILIAEKVIEAFLKPEKISKRIGMTGSPGAGKSTLINALGKKLLDENNSIAVLAIDPSSSISKGSILGDKTRMEDIANHENCFIRPTPSSSTLGGVARKTRETILLCEAFGFDYIIIETVGVGQSEIVIKNMVDLMLLLLLPNAGDELQGIKRGIMEIVDIVLINKSDKENMAASRITAAQVKQALHLFPATEKNWAIPVINISAIENSGLEELKQKMDAYFLQMKTSGYLLHNRNLQKINQLNENIEDIILQKFKSDIAIQQLKSELEEKIKSDEIDVNQAAKLISDKFFNNG